MYISIWLIIIIVAILYFYIRGLKKNNNGASTQDKSIEETQQKLDLDKTIAKMKKHSGQFEYTKYVNTFNFDSIERIIQNHNAYVEQIKTEPDKIKKEREKLDQELGFGKRLRQFTVDIKQWPTWHNNPKLGKDGVPWWKSKAIPPSDLVLKNFSDSDLKKYAAQYDKFKDDDQIIEY